MNRPDNGHFKPHESRMLFGCQLLAGRYGSSSSRAFSRTFGCSRRAAHPFHRRSLWSYQRLRLYSRPKTGNPDAYTAVHQMPPIRSHHPLQVQRRTRAAHSIHFTSGTYPCRDTGFLFGDGNLQICLNFAGGHLTAHLIIQMPGKQAWFVRTVSGLRKKWHGHLGRVGLVHDILDGLVDYFQGESA